MTEKLLIVSDSKSDLGLLEDLLGAKKFAITKMFRLEPMEKIIREESFAAIIADLNYVGDMAFSWLTCLEEQRSKPCLILYGDNINAGKVSEMVQKGAYGFIPRPFLSERIHDAILGGLENRKAFVQILGMMDDLNRVNDTLIRERTVLESKNKALAVINRLSSEVAYDRNWDRILPRIFDAGLSGVVDPEFLSILHRIGSQWNLDLYVSGKRINTEMVERFKAEIAATYFSLSDTNISASEIVVHLYPPDIKVSSSFPISTTDLWAMPLNLEGMSLGLLSVLPKGEDVDDFEKKEFMSTIANILAMSLSNAKEYQSLKRMTIKDGLTGILNRKGFMDFLEPEFQKARRHKNPLSLIMMDIDNFKMINDTLGHQAGDYVLQELAGCMMDPLRQSDIVARYGGDEFSIVLPETGIKKAELFLKRLLAVIRDHGFYWKSKHIKVEISCGVSAVSELTKMQTEEDLIGLADIRLYHAKRSQKLSYAQAV